MAVPSAGTLVTLRGISSKPELNGCAARVLGEDHSAEAAAGYAKGRVPVLLLSSGGGTMLLRPEALEVTSEPTSSRSERIAPEWSDYSYDQLCTMGWDYFEKGVRMVAIECLQQATALEPDSFLAHFQLGQVHEASQGDEPGSAERAAIHFLAAQQTVAPESKSPDYNDWWVRWNRTGLRGLPR
jgi:hypothetical protein